MKVRNRKYAGRPIWVEECTEGMCPCILDTMGQKNPNDTAVALNAERGLRGNQYKPPFSPFRQPGESTQRDPEFRVAASPSQPPLLCPT